MANPIDTTKPPLDVFFDESGFTGPDLLDLAQPYFSYASVAVSDDEGWDILKEARDRHYVQMPELKAQKLLKSASGIALIELVLDKLESRYTFVVQNKLLVLCGKLFEYIYEPVVQNAPQLLYDKGLHRFVAMYGFIFFQGELGERVITEFQSYMRSLDQTDAPLLFDPANRHLIKEDDPFGLVVDFAQGYRSQITADNERMKKETADQGKWALDVSIAGLWSLLNHWGQKGHMLNVTCDDSKPIRAIISEFHGGDDDLGLQRLRAMGRDDDGFGFHFTRSVAFADSRGSPGLQIADLIAGSATGSVRDNDSQFDGIRERLQRHIHRDSIAPDFNVVELGTKACDVNWLVLMELARRAKAGTEPLIGLDVVYKYAEDTWDPRRFG
ncbi:MAG: DUF3800 domain-containing protein [Methylococcales bacterium]